MKILLSGSGSLKFRAIEVESFELEIKDNVVYLTYCIDSSEYVYRTISEYSRALVKCKNIAKGNLIDLTSGWQLVSVSTEDCCCSVEKVNKDWYQLCDKFNTFYMSLNCPNEFEKEMHVNPSVFYALRCRDINTLNQYNYDYINNCVTRTMRSITSLLLKTNKD